MNTNMTGLDGFQNLCSCALDESGLSIGSVKLLLSLLLVNLIQT